MSGGGTDGGPVGGGTGDGKGATGALTPSAAVKSLSGGGGDAKESAESDGEGNVPWVSWVSLAMLLLVYISNQWTRSLVYCECVQSYCLRSRGLLDACIWGLRLRNEVPGETRNINAAASSSIFFAFSTHACHCRSFGSALPLEVYARTVNLPSVRCGQSFLVTRGSLTSGRAFARRARNMTVSSPFLSLRSLPPAPPLVDYQVMVCRMCRCCLVRRVSASDGH